MNKVYIVIEHFLNYEESYDDIVSVHTSKEGAEAKRNLMMEERHPTEKDQLRYSVSERLLEP